MAKDFTWIQIFKIITHFIWRFSAKQPLLLPLSPCCALPRSKIYVLWLPIKNALLSGFEHIFFWRTLEHETAFVNGAVGVSDAVDVTGLKGIVFFVPQTEICWATRIGDADGADVLTGWRFPWSTWNCPLHPSLNILLSCATATQ